MPLFVEETVGLSDFVQIFLSQDISDDDFPLFQSMKQEEINQQLLNMEKV